MNSEPNNCIGRDDDNNGGLIALAIILLVICTIVAIMVFCGAFIGLYHSIRNYIISFKVNVVDANRRLGAAA